MDIQPGCLVLVRYLDHVLFHRSNAEAAAPQTRECTGWLVYSGPDYIVVSWDRDSGPPGLKSGDPKASDLVILRGEILDLRRATDGL